jgi:aspartyl-tRNA(Asn)/glutamyl-tRNA(Gln) amidotransferase subunit C
MSLSLEQIKHLAFLARLEFSDQEIREFYHDLNTILDFVDQLKKIKTENLELKIPEREINLLREDQAKKNLNSADLLKQAPEKLESYFRIPPLFKEAR